ncbi:ATG8-interacting protein 1 [Syzygium oleosum]|uniref:ATG8-interacting protein 1 n=1 Tax=Syzygium oleosum TaxID=219896 RepID=UPI0011D2C02D|nr:ATG8-interacting protein 1 [Syzygium oleosum]
MADKDEGEETVTRRNEWEVVSLTASAYTAAPGPDVELKTDDKGNAYDVDDAEISRALFMSGHFVFPPSQHENLPLAPEKDQPEEEKQQDDVAELETEGGISSGKDQKDTSFRTTHDEFPGVECLDETGGRQFVHDKEFEEGMSLQGLDMPYADATLSSFHGEAALGGLNPSTYVDNTSTELTEHEHVLESAEELSRSSKSTKDHDYYETDLPCGAWWKKRAVSFYTHAKEANTFWSIFVAAAVTGLVILGQRWQQERWQVLQLKWQMAINDEKMGRLLGPIYRMKDVIVGGHRRGSFIRGSSSSEN